MEEYKLFKPTLLDIVNMQNLVQIDVDNGNILQRDPNEMATTIRSYTCVKINGEIVGFAALHIYTTTLAEIRSLIVDKRYRGKGIAKQLILNALTEAKTFNLKKVLVLTYKKELFQSLGFEEIAKESIPETKIWADCIKCKHFPICDEISLTITI